MDVLHIDAFADAFSREWRDGCFPFSLYTRLPNPLTMVEVRLWLHYSYHFARCYIFDHSQHMAHRTTQTAVQQKGSEGNEKAWATFLIILINHRPPRWSSGYPRMLLAVTIEFELHRDDVVNLFARIKKRNQTAESA